MRLVKLDDDVWVNPEHVTYVERCGAGATIEINATRWTVNVDVYEVLNRLNPSAYSA